MTTTEANTADSSLAAPRRVWSKTQTSAKNYLRILRYGLRQWPSLLLLSLMSLATSMLVALEPWPFKILVDYALGDGEVPTLLNSAFDAINLSPTPAILIVTAAVASLLLFALHSLIGFVSTWAWSFSSQHMLYDLAGDLFGRLQRLSLLFHSRRAVGDSLNRLTGDTWCASTVTDNLVLAPLGSIFVLITIGGVAWQLDSQLTVIMFFLTPVLAISAIYFGSRLKHRARKDREAQSRLFSIVQQTLAAIPVVQAFAAESRNRYRFEKMALEAVDTSKRYVLVQSCFTSMSSLTTTIGTGLVLVFGGQRVLSGDITVGSLLVFLAYLQSLQSAVQALLASYGELKGQEASIDRVLEILDEDDQIQDVSDAVLLSTANSRSPGHVVIENVTCGYESDREVLHEINLEARPGEMIAVVGPTGAGKSTLMSLIPRFISPWTGRVTFDGIDVREITLESLRSNIAFVLQESFLLPLSVADNIAYGRPGAKRDDIIASALASNAHDFISRLPNGYDTVIGERGATLSGGERQRLAIARALLRDAPVLILDEPTSALDSETEAQVMEALERLMENRTTFIIAHRLSTIRKATRIAVMERGSVVEIGNHDDLMSRRGNYYRQYSLQFAKPMEKGAS
jgi:ABC-type multidrug transport system fused ATPase/permease subunit